MIEQTISLGESAQKIAPDVVAVSNKLVHAIVVDCKGGANIEPDQDRRYESLKSRDLTYHITVHDPKRLTHVTCYADDADVHKLLEPHTELPFITFGRDMMSGKRDFGKKQVNDKLCKPVSLEGMLEPTGHYPFSPDDEKAAIIPHVLPGLLSHLIKRGRSKTPTVADSTTAESILKIIHPFHEQIDSRHKKRLAESIKIVIDMCKDSNSEFKQQLAKIEDGKAVPSTIQSLHRICNELIDKYADQKLIDSY